MLGAGSLTVVYSYENRCKSGCKAESYRLAGESMSSMLGFLTVIAAQLLQMTYLHRNSPHSSAADFLMVAMATKISCSLALEAIQSQIPQLTRATI